MQMVDIFSICIPNFCPFSFAVCKNQVLFEHSDGSFCYFPIKNMLKKYNLLIFAIGKK